MKFSVTIYQRPNTRGLFRDSHGFTQAKVIDLGDTEAMSKAVEWDNSPARYTGGHKVGTKFEVANCILADIDNTHSDNPDDWILPKHVSATLRGVAHSYYPSKNHMREKDGRAPRPKYHFIIPIRETTAVNVYTGSMRWLIDTKPDLHFDQAVKGPAQLNFGVEGAQVVYVEGTMNLTDYMEMYKAAKSAKTKKGKTDSNDVIPQGQRNSTLFRCAATALTRYGDVDGRARQAFDERVAMCSPLLENSEVDRIWESALVFFRTHIQTDPNYVPPERYNEGQEQRSTQAETLLELVGDVGVAFFHSDTNDCYAVIPVGKHQEVWSLESRNFNVWLHKLYYDNIGKPVGNEAVGRVLLVLTAKALFDNPDPVTLSTRVATHDSAFWYDLAHPEWKAVKVTGDGWNIVDNPPILFHRYNHQKAQTMAQSGGDINKILEYINLKENRTLFLCWLVSCFVPNIPHPMPIFFGEKGAAKTTTCTLLKSLIDPSELETLALEKDQRSLLVSLQQHWFLPLDNVSHISGETSDALCRAITGGGISHRLFFTNGESFIMKFQRCLAVNGINNVATRPDLLDRAILVELERISEDDRRELSEVMSKFLDDSASILGGIFDTLSRAMAIYPTVKLDKLPRMADFCRWSYAIGEALGGFGEQFLAEYTANIASQNAEAVNADPVATLVVAFMTGRGTWYGMVSELLNALMEIAPRHGIYIGSKGLPKTANHLGRRLNSLKSNLEAVGIPFERDDTNSKGAYITLSNTNLPALPPYFRKI